MGRGGIVGLVLATACTGGSEPGRGGPSTTATSAGLSTSGSDTGEADDTGPSSSSSGSGSSTTSTTEPSSSSGAPETSTTDDPTTGGPAGPPACPVAGAPIDCSPGPGSGENDTCTDDPSCFLQTVKDAVTGVMAEHPEWFDESAGTPFVLDPEAYMNAVVERVLASGECSIRDPNAGDEIVVKHDNAFAENFDILSAEGNARWGDGIYTSKCIPAWF